jgi:hypothetical protein
MKASVTEPFDLFGNGSGPILEHAKEANIFKKLHFFVGFVHG